MSREEILKPFPEKNADQVKTHPNPLNSAVWVYKYGRLEKIEPATHENLGYYEPELPPKYYEDERVNTKAVIDRALPEGKFAAGGSPHLQVILKKAMDMEGAGKFPTVGNFYNAIAKEQEIEPKGDETRDFVRGYVEDKITKPGGPGYLTRRRGNYKVGNLPSLSSPLIPFRRRVNPHQDRIVKFLEGRDNAEYEAIRGRIMGEPLRWTDDVDYFDECLEAVVEKGSVVEITDNVYKYVKRLPTFEEEEKKGKGIKLLPF